MFTIKQMTKPMLRNTAPLWFPALFRMSSAEALDDVDNLRQSIIEIRFLDDQRRCQTNDVIVGLFAKHSHGRELLAVLSRPTARLVQIDSDERATAPDLFHPRQSFAPKPRRHPLTYLPRA